MADISKIKIQDNTYDIKDATARARNIPSGGTTGQILSKASGNDYDAEWTNPSGGGTWGSITGNIANQTDLQNALSTKVNIIDCGGIQIRPDYVISSVDLTDGVSVLDSGKLYFYYEA